MGIILPSKRVKMFFFLLLYFLIPSFGIQAQTELSGNDKYKIITILIEENYLDEALERLENERSSLADLLKAKIYYRQSLFKKSLNTLNRVYKNELVSGAWYEVQYLKLLNNMQLKNFVNVFDLILKIKEDPQLTSSDLSQIEVLYKQLLTYLSIEERKQVLSSSRNSSMNADLLSSAIYRISYSHLLELYNYSLQAGLSIPQTVKERIIVTLSSEEEYLAQQKLATFEYPNANSYHFNLLLPFFEKESAEFNIVQGLYNGFKLAIDRYNKRYQENPIYLNSINTLDRVKLKDNWNDAINNDKTDFIIGPLFSEVLGTVSNFENLNDIPLFAPLANTADYASLRKWIFQVNPEFRIRGKKAATFLKNSLEADSVLVIAEKASLGEISAEAFSIQAVSDSLTVSKYLVEDFANVGYDLRPYADFFSTDTTLIDSLDIQTFDAVYAPISGATSETMIRLLMTALESNQNYPVILGSGEWNNFELTGLQRSRFSIWYDSFQLINTQHEGFDTFILNYEEEYGNAPNQQALLGYDLGLYLTNLISTYKNPKLILDLLPSLEPYKGISVTFDYSESRVNSHLFYQLKE